MISVISILSIIILILVVIILIAIIISIININKDIKRGSEIIDNIEKITENLSSEQKKFDNILNDISIVNHIKNLFTAIFEFLRFYKKLKHIKNK
ncbi:hypothetical protein M1145_02210 [Patescibacteria group bacterium]|nr:hypothetical protein [Patescibacteria group bacterium]